MENITLPVLGPTMMPGVKGPRCRALLSLSSMFMELDCFSVIPTLSCWQAFTTRFHISSFIVQQFPNAADFQAKIGVKFPFNRIFNRMQSLVTISDVLEYINKAMSNMIEDSLSLSMHFCGCSSGHINCVVPGYAAGSRIVT